MSGQEIIRDYVEREPLVAAQALPLGDQEREQMATSLSINRAQMVVDAIQGELLSRRETLGSELAVVDDWRSEITQGIDEIDIALSPPVTGSETPVLRTSQILEKFLSNKKSSRMNFLRNLEDEPFFDVQLLTPNPFYETWVDTHKGELIRMFGQSNLQVFSRAVNSIACDPGFVKEMERLGVVENATIGEYKHEIKTGNAYIRVESLRIVEPKLFVKHAIRLADNFGLHAGAALVALADVQKKIPKKYTVFQP